VDIDFLIRRTAANRNKLKAIATELQAMILRPYYPVSDLFRIARDEDGLQLDFMTVADGIRSYGGLRKRAIAVHFEGARLLVASRADIIGSKKAAVPGTWPCLQSWREPLKKPPAGRKAKLAALKKESELALRDQIRRLLALPPERRTHFLRKRVGIRMSCV